MNYLILSVTMHSQVLRSARVLAVIGGLSCWAGAANAAPDADNQIDFTRQVQPLLVNHCYECHGPKQQEGGLRWDSKWAAFAGGDSGEPAITPGDSAASELIRRIRATDPDEQMPPEGPRLSEEELALLERWIDEGAIWPEAKGKARPKHWAYVAPQRPQLPEVSAHDWPQNAIDYFVLARLEREGLQPSPPAEKDRLLRRVYLDLIGLPPSPAEVESFLADNSPNSYSRVVEKLLSSPRYGERWARPWLDLARYADSNGFQADQYREIWPYRDWVIAALNADMPFDQFTIEQLAGDLLPDSTTQQKIATGFQRNTTCNVEAGVDPEENRVNQVVDRVNTLGAVWLGTTLECAQCHNHKYDPFTQKEYYQLFAYFNNTPLEVKHTKATTFDFVGPKMPLKDLTPPGKKQQPPTTLVMVESESRSTQLMKRGNFLDLGISVVPDTPLELHAKKSHLSLDRLGFAQWLVDEDNPLVARVTVNRWWQEMFGAGIVATSEDFGTQGELPTHPGVLDYLAVEFMNSGWSAKHVHRLIVNSATYQQSSRVTPELLSRDPYNKLLARGPRVRMTAEMIRDNALAATGLLSTKMGGPPIYPPQPDGIWRHVGRNAPKYQTSKGGDRFRRGIFVVWRRSAPYASFVNFDAPDRASCVIKRPRTNTPLQALTLLNDAAYVELSLALAKRIMEADEDMTLGDRVRFGFRLCVAREPSEREAAILENIFTRELARLENDPAAVKALVKQSPVKSAKSQTELAAWFFVANVLLNLDETITKG